jgi:hypothetical protein
MWVSCYKFEVSVSLYVVIVRYFVDIILSPFGSIRYIARIIHIEISLLMRIELYYGALLWRK